MFLKDSYARLLSRVSALVLCVAGSIAQADNIPFPAKYLDLVGNYHSRAGILYAIQRANHGIRLLNYQTGLQSDLVESEDGGFKLVDAKDHEFVRFRRDKAGRVTALTLTVNGGPVSARRAPYSTDDVTFVGSDGVKLAGTVWMPAGRGPFPAIVFVHGSGPVTRYQFGEFANFAVDHGYAVLTYDKRGSGASSGDFHPWVTSLSLLADDALAGLELMRSRPHVRPAQVGLFGISNGSWVVVQAAARSLHVGFAVLAVGGGVPMLDDDLYEAGMQVRRAGMGEQEVQKLHDILTQLLGPVDSTVDGATAVKQTRDLLAEASHYPWYKINGADQAAAMPDKQLLGLRTSVWRNETSYDPAGDLEKIRVPVLAIMGEKDGLTPTAENEVGLATHLAAAGNPDVTLRILPGASHWMTLGFVDTDPGVNMYAPGLFDTLGAWLARIAVEDRIPANQGG